MEAAKNSAAGRLNDLTANAASSINMSEIEANIQAELQAKLNSGASKADLLAQADSMDLTTAPAATDAQSVIASVLAKHNIAAPVAAPAMSIA